MNPKILLVAFLLLAGLFPALTKSTLILAVDVTHGAFAIASGAVAHAANQ